MLRLVIAALIAVAGCRRAEPPRPGPLPGPAASASAPASSVAAPATLGALPPPCADGACPPGLACTDEPGAPCGDQCPEGWRCDGERGACVMPRCTDACTHRAGRYKYSDRELLRFDRAPAGLEGWVWSSPCEAHGACSSSPTGCGATLDAHCAASLACTWYGRCVARDGACVATSADACRAARSCSDSGRCSLAGDECVATSPDDCRASAMCKAVGWCSVQDGLCRVAPGAYPHGEAMGRRRQEGTSPDAVSGATRRAKEARPEAPTPPGP